MWKACWKWYCACSLSGQIIVIVDSSVLGFEGMSQRFEVTPTGMNVCSVWDINSEHCSLIAWSFLACKAVIHDGGFMRGWNGAIILQNCPFCMLTGYVLLIHDSNYL